MSLGKERMKKKKVFIPVRESVWLETWNHREKKKKREKERRKITRKQPESIAPLRNLKKKPRNSSFVNNCIVFKVQSLYTKVQLCWPHHPQSKRKPTKGKAQTLGRRAKQNTKLRERIFRMRRGCEPWGRRESQRRRASTWTKTALKYRVKSS